MASSLGLFPTPTPFSPLANSVANSVNSLSVVPASTGAATTGIAQPVIEPWLQSLVANSPKYPASSKQPLQLNGSGNFNFSEFEKLFKALMNGPENPKNIDSSNPKQSEPTIASAEKALNEVFTKGLNSTQADNRKKNGAAWQDFAKSLSSEQRAAQQRWHILKAKGVPESEWKAAHKKYSDSLTPEQRALHEKSMNVQRTFKGSLSTPQRQMQDSIYDLRMLNLVEQEAKSQQK